MSTLDSQCAYSLILRNTSPIIDPGRTLRVEVYLSGYGTPEKNKLSMNWSIPDVIDDKDPGSVVHCVKATVDTATGKPKPLAGQVYTESRTIGKNGMEVVLNEGHFLDVPNLEGLPKHGFSPVIAESGSGTSPPLLLSLKTAEHAPSGDYDVTFVLTYSSGQSIHQDCKSTQFHVTSWWDRNQAWIALCATLAALAALILTAVGAVWQIFNWQPKG